MGMALTLRTISDSNIEKVLSDPPLILKVIASDGPDMDLAEGEGVEFDLDKAWHGIHYLLTGTAWGGNRPLDFLINGGTQVGDVDIGYGPARVLSSTEVTEICEALSSVDASVFKDRFNPEEMTALDIYPDIWERDPEDDDTLEYCIENYIELKNFLENARSNKLGVTLCIC